jgi:hypothetical protein
MLSREYIQGKEAVFIIKGVKESSFLFAMNRVIGRVKVQDYFSGWCVKG